MKKVFLAFGAAALMTAGFTSCNKAASNASSEDVAFGDSIAVALGKFAGAQANNSYSRMIEMQPEVADKYQKASFLKGVQAILNADTTDVAYYQGIQMGLQLVQPINGISNTAHFPVDKNKVLEAFKSTYNSDSIADMSQFYSDYQTIMTQLQARVSAREAAAKAESPEAKENLAAGQAYAEKMLQEGYSKSPSGLVYKIENPGTDPKIEETDMVNVLYVGKNIEGEVFDTNEGNVRPMRAAGFVPGFKEALSMLGKGGKMTVVIPGDLAYGLDGAGDQIGPNQTLVFDIEIQDVNAK